jgi:hypothetical protein
LPNCLDLFIEVESKHRRVSKTEAAHQAATTLPFFKEGLGGVVQLSENFKKFF